jgi:RimJ/RimL family protein N-acetyltransferase
MQVLVGQDVDVIAPFPASALPAAVGWMYCYRTLVFGDRGPQTQEEVGQFLAQALRNPGMLTWGIVDKNNLTRSHQIDVPLVGVVFAERLTEENAYIHIASSRKAWGNRVAQPGLVDQGCELIKSQIWEQIPDLRRLSIATFASNRAARSLAVRAGFHQDGYFTAMGTLRNAPQDIVHFGLLRPEASQEA